MDDNDEAVSPEAEGSQRTQKKEERGPVQGVPRAGGEEHDDA